MNGRFLFILLLLLLWFLLGWFFFKKHLCPQTSNSSPVAAVVDPCGEWSFNDDDNFKQKVGSHYQFRRSGFTPLATDTGLGTAITATSDYLKSNNDRSLTITGLYDTQESNQSILANLGLARANAIKKLFLANGVNGGQVSIDSDVNGSSCYRGDTLRKGALFSFGAADIGSTRLDDIRARLQGKPITLYFGTNQDNIELSPQQRTDFTDLIYYIDNVTDAGLGISGHTDIVGNRSSNVKLSLSRADFVKEYLRRNGGISEARMTTQGFGPDKPVATNQTEDGRALNRRVEVTLK